MQITKSHDEDYSILEKQTTHIALKAIEKELTIEDLIKREEEEKQKQEELKIKLQIESELKKKLCIVKAIKEKKLENEQISKSKEYKKKIEEIKENAKAEVLKRRNKLKEEIQKIRKKADLRKYQLTQKLFEVRTSIASEVGKAYKKGDLNICKKSVNSMKSRHDYCIANFSDDFGYYNYCQKSDDFCEICCDNEFGDMFMEDREKCLKDLCEKKKELDEEKKPKCLNN